MVIGDIVKIEKNKVFTCDMIILKGECLINQAVLTGESMPIHKVPIKKTMNEFCIIYAGSTCL